MKINVTVIVLCNIMYLQIQPFTQSCHTNIHLHILSLVIRYLQIYQILYIYKRNEGNVLFNNTFMDIQWQAYGKRLFR